ncbi:MAG: hypothetical protein U0V87_09630 [Acidobacteriota bacterium]
MLYVVDYDSLGCDEAQHGDFCGTPVGRCTRPTLVRGGRMLTLRYVNEYEF